MPVRPQNKGKQIFICGSTLKPPQFHVSLLYTVLLGWYHWMNLNQLKKAELNPKVLVSEVRWAVSPESSGLVCAPRALVSGCSTELGQRCLEHCPDLGKPLRPHCHYSFFHPQEGINCVTLPRAALLLSYGFIPSAGWKRWVSLVFAPMQPEKRARHKSGSKTCKRWMVWGIQPPPAKWMKH